MMMDSDTTNMEKVQVIKELHNLTKTSVLLLRDLPFVSNLSKYYDLRLAEPHYDKNDHLLKNQLNEDNEKREKEIIERKVSEHLEKMIDDSALFTVEQKQKMRIVEPTTDGVAKVTDHVNEDMQKQLNYTPEEILQTLNNKDYQESIRKIREIKE